MASDRMTDDDKDDYLELRNDFLALIEIVDAIAEQCAERGLIPSGDGSPVARMRRLYRKTVGVDEGQTND